jgi:hypothetical protein
VTGARRVDHIIYAAGLLAAVAGAVVLVILWHPWPRHGADRVRHLMRWSACVRVVSDDVEPRASGWPHAQEVTDVECEMLGPSFRHARFTSRGDLRRDLLARPPSRRVCVYGDEVVVDGLELGEITRVCGRLHGDVVDGIRGREAPGATPVPTTAWLRRNNRFRSRLEGAALRRYFATRS